MRIPLYVNVQCFNVNHFIQGYAQLNVNSNRLASTDSTDLRKVMAEKIPAFQEEVKAFRKNHGNKVIGEITVDQVNLDRSVAVIKAFLLDSADFLCKCPCIRAYSLHLPKLLTTYLIYNLLHELWA